MVAILDRVPDFLGHGDAGNDVARWPTFLDVVI